MKFIVLSLLLFIAACGHLPEDKTPAPIDYGLWTAELVFDGKRDLGLMGTVFTREDLAKKLEFPVWGKGEYTIRSQRCLFTKEGQFDSQSLKTISFTLKELTTLMPNAEFACIFNINIFIEGFDKGLQGQFVAIKDEGFNYMEAFIGGRSYSGVGWFQLRETASTAMEFYFNSFIGPMGKESLVDKSGKMFFEGCGRSGELDFDGSFAVPLSFFTGNQRPQKCVYEIGFEFDDGSKGIFTFNLKVFDQTVLDIPDPELSYKNGKLKLKSSKPVAYVAIGEKYKRGIRISDKVGDESVWVRMITANGRYKLLEVEKGEIIWKPSLIY